MAGTKGENQQRKLSLVPVLESPGKCDPVCLPDVPTLEKVPAQSEWALPEGHHPASCGQGLKDAAICVKRRKGEHTPVFADVYLKCL